eukprot:735798-Rhodomonas_salina.1
MAQAAGAVPVRSAPCTHCALSGGAHASPAKNTGPLPPAQPPSAPRAAQSTPRARATSRRAALVWPASRRAPGGTLAGVAPYRASVPRIAHRVHRRVAQLTRRISTGHLARVGR